MSMFGSPKPAGGKPLAALSSTLLARKGQAKPAMRPQGFGGFGSMPGGQDDLGWNDMGHDGGQDGGHDAAERTPELHAVPPVLQQREALAEEFAPPPAAPGAVAPAEIVPEPQPVPVPDTPPRALKPVSVATAARFGRETAKTRGKAAFTLRLDQDRHLRLRLASALQGASAQALVTDALDQFLQSLPEVDALVAQLPPRPIRPSK